MTVSVIVPAYNAQATIGQVLAALFAQDYKGVKEFIVVDDGSTDQTAVLVQKFPSVICIHQENAGPAAARNHGARVARGEFLCFTDADCIAHVDWISKLLNGFKSSDIGVVNGSYGIANKESLLARGIHGEIMFRHHHLMPDFPKAFGSYNFCIKKEVFNQVGGFSIKYRQASGEDNDLSYRILDAGHKIFFKRDALVDHYHTMDVGKYLKEQFRHGYWRAHMYLEHPGRSMGDDYTFWKDLLEVPWCILCLIGLFFFIMHLLEFKVVFYFLFVSFLFFEIYFGMTMLRALLEGFYFGFVMYLRAFSRTFGLSTGFLYFIGTKNKKKF